ncbi:MAG: ABC transporter ATP-binding protein [Variovorax sp.]
MIDGLALSVEAGEFVCIVGPSGCGKSTFLHMVGGFEPASEGDMLLHGKQISKPAPDRGMMFQDYSLYPWLTVLENVCWPLEMQGVAKGDRLARGRQILETVNLKRFAGFYPGQLSGGMKQRVALARLLALDSEMMLMDEPFGALDAQTRELLQEELQSVWLRTDARESASGVLGNTGGQRKTALFVTHDIDEAIFLGTRLVVFTAYPGRVKADIRIPSDVDRGVNFRKSAEYHRIRNEVWDLLREEVLKVKQKEEA